jgi:hypothetical protein
MALGGADEDSPCSLDLADAASSDSPQPLAAQGSPKPSDSNSPPSSPYYGKAPPPYKRRGRPPGRSNRRLSKSEKVEDRKQRNRLAAQHSRLRKKCELENTRMRNEELEALNSQLQEQVKQLRAENERLRRGEALAPPTAQLPAPPAPPLPLPSVAEHWAEQAGAHLHTRLEWVLALLALVQAAAALSLAAPAAVRPWLTLASRTRPHLPAPPQTCSSDSRRASLWPAFSAEHAVGVT